MALNLRRLAARLERIEQELLMAEPRVYTTATRYRDADTGDVTYAHGSDPESWERADIGIEPSFRAP